MKTKSVILGALFLTSLAMNYVACSEEKETTDSEWVAAGPNDQVRTDSQGNNFMLYMGLWYLMNSRGMINPYAHPGYSYSGGGFHRTNTNAYRSGKISRPSATRGGFGTTGRSYGGSSFGS